MPELILLDKIANLQADYEVASVDLAQEYWVPNEVGESRRLIYWDIRPRRCLDESGKELQLDCAAFVEPSQDGNHRVVVNGSRRLVGIFEANSIAQGTPVQVTYRGKEKNKTNSRLSDTWSVQVLVKKGGDNA